MTEENERPAKRRRAATPLEPDSCNSATATTSSNARSSAPRLTDSDYTVGWICALPIEMAASRTMFDELHPSLIQDEADTNTYTLGRIGEHNVVLVCLPSGTMGTSPAATAAANMLRTFPKIRFGLMVGVGGGAPGPPSNDPCEDLRLGDVVVSNPDKECGGVIQYDFGRTIAAGKFVQTGLLNKPPAVLRSAVSTLRALHLTEGPSTYRYVCEMMESKPNMAPKFQYPGTLNDLLFDASYDHFNAEFPNCERCDRRQLVSRGPRMTPDPVIHYGTIGSANQVMRHGGTRDKLCREKNIICFEMEAAGLMDQFPCLVIRGICDYSDTHKTKQWQPYAAATAAAYAKELLEVIPAVQVNATEEVTRALRMVTTAINESLEPLKKGQERKDKEEILDWLAPPIYKAQYNDYISKHQEGTGTWFLESPEFASWAKGVKPTLFCHGIPGAGKTILAAAAIRHLLTTRAEHGHYVAFVFCNYRLQEEQTVETLMAAILRQVIEQCPLSPDSVKKMYASYKSNKARPSSSDMLAMLCSISRDNPRLFVVIDALDECLDSVWKPLIRSMRQLQQEAGTSLMVTSRPNEVRRREFLEDIHLDIRARDGDIESFLHGQLGGLSDCVVEDTTLQASIVKQITQLADGMFLLAKLHLESLRGKRTRGHVEEVIFRLQSQVKGYGALQSAYENALERIDSQQSDDRAWATSVMSWVVHARRPLKVQELQHALAVRTGDRDLHPDYIPAFSALCEILSLCAGLVTLSRDHTVVELVHYTTQQYFEDANHQPEWIRTAPILIAATCLTYLSFDSFATESGFDDAELDEKLAHYALLEYSALYWGDHARGNQKALEVEVTNFLINESLTPCASQILTKSKEGRYAWFAFDIPLPSSLHLAALFGLDRSTKTLIDGKIDVNSCDSHGRTPLLWAAKEGHEAVVKLLLKANDIDPDIPDNAGCSPLSYAAENGHEEIVKYLLEGTCVSSNTRDSLGRTPLHWAVRNGHTSIAALLMESKHCNPHVADEFGDTPLHWAAESGDTPMIEILVRNKEEVTFPGFIKRVENWPDPSSVFDPNMEGIQDRTALGLAIRGGHHASAALILRIYATKTAYSSPLGESLMDYAIESGQSYIIKLVLRIVGIDLDVSGEGEKALWRAACFGDADLVKALLDSGCVDPNARTVSPLQTPLVAAVGASHWKVVELLLQRRDVDINSSAGDGTTPLALAAGEHNWEMVLLLLQRPDVSLDIQDLHGRTTLAVAAQNDSVIIVESLLQRSNAELNIPDFEGKTPLALASENGGFNTVELLLQQKDVELNPVDRSGRTPLGLAAMNGHTKVVGRFLEDRDVKPAVRDRDGLTPLALAQRGGHLDTANAIREHLYKRYTEGTPTS